MTVLDECKNKTNLRTRFPANRKPCTSNYDYEEDSDLEEDSDDDDDDFSDDELAVTPPTIATGKLRNDPSELVTIEHSDMKSGEPSDIISVSDLDSLFSESSNLKEEIEPTHFGKVIIIEDVAFVT